MDSESSRNVNETRCGGIHVSSLFRFPWVPHQDNGTICFYTAVVCEVSAIEC